MRAGTLRDKITLLSPAENDWGEPDPGSQKEIATISAEIINQSGDSGSTAGASTSKETVKVKIRWRKAIASDQCFRWLSNVYDIAHIERDRKRRWMILTGESEQ